MHTPHACTRLMKKLGGRTGAVGGGGWLQLREVLAGHHHLDGSLDLLQARVLLDDLDAKGLLRRRGGLGTHDCCRGRHIVFLLLDMIGNDLNGDSDSPDRSLGCADLSVIIHTWMMNDLGDLALSWTVGFNAGALSLPPVLVTGGTGLRPLPAVKVWALARPPPLVFGGYLYYVYCGPHSLSDGVVITARAARR